MEKTLLKYLICPFCAGGLQVDKVINVKDNKIIDGILRCSCRRYPIISSILCLQGDEKSEMALRLLDKKKTHAALYLMLEGRMMKKIISLAKRLHLAPSFYSIISFWNWKYWTAYLRYRFSAPNFICSLALMPAIKEAGGYMLDVCAGVGHFAFIAAKHVPATRIVCVERRFTSLYLAREFFAPSAAGYIDWDASQMLPFVDGFFNSVVCVDSFHYIDTKYLFSREMMRVLDKDGILLIPHIHNSNLQSVLPGTPLSPSHYQSLFSDFEIRMIPEEDILKDLLSEHVVDLGSTENEPAPPAVNNTEAFTLAASKSDRYFKRYSTEMLFESSPVNLIVNPIYQVKKCRDGICLKLKFPCRLYKAEFPLIERYFEKKLFISTEDLKDTEKRMVWQKRFVLVDVPLRFMNRKSV
ncbi:class I SAM-dependent methyltransferase [Candidatus Desantisbacteria bacterium]|nr:class I SAM-dependent methyltransferase [Candidatus Desantisbacteria bacterium]